MIAPARPRVLAWAAVLLLGVALRAPSLRVGRLGDDWYHLSMIEGTYPVPRSATDLYDFIRDDPAEHSAFRARGVFPWWTTPSLKLAPWRPLASASLALDHTLFGRSPVGPHAVSLAAWAALLLAAAWWLRATLPEPFALLALGLLAVDESATVPIAWIANRASLLSVAFGLFGAGVLARTRGRADPRALAAITSLFSLAVLAGEYGLAVTGAAVTFELLAHPGAWRTERTRLAAALAPCVVYVIAWKLLGHGARGTTAYVDPLSQPALWFSTARGRAPAFVAELTCAIPIAVADAVPRLTLLALALAGAITAATLARADAPRRRVAVALLVSVAVALLPILSAPPNGRVLLPAATPFAAALAALAWCAWSAPSRPVGWILRGAVALAVVTHLTVAPVRVRRDLAVLTAWRATEIPWRALPGVDPCHTADQDQILLATQDFETVHSAPLHWQAHGCAQPRTWRILSTATGATIVLRDGASALEVRAPSGSVLGGIGPLWRVAPALRVGERVEATGFTAEVLAAERGQPTRIRYTFDRSLDDPRVLLWVATAAGFEQVRPPPIGRGRLVPPAATRFW